ncbi:hypothetical protein [Thermus brockianus]|uniref:Uncharacterized protein n=1 Tax=Thermus brockianus TaxID=56956 RepID=A0ABN6NKI3_THEBO|nr:hypothetical protein [Thermus brockianus]BDG16938.1 hypothetical protein TbrSNM41_16720 [Thermus brockianus]
MQITYAEQVALPGHKLRYRYRYRDGILTATLERPDGTTLEEVYDLSDLQPGDEVVEVEPETLPFSPLLYARRDEEGNLHLKLLLWYEGGSSLDQAIAEAWPEGVPNG